MYRLFINLGDLGRAPSRRQTFEENVDITPGRGVLNDRWFVLFQDRIYNIQGTLGELLVRGEE